MALPARAGLRVTAAVALAVGLVALSGAARAAPSQDPSTPEGAAALICAQLQAMLGAQFASQFGSAAACQARAADVVRGAIEACKAQANPPTQACIAQAIQQGVIAMSASGGTGPSAAEITEQVLDKTCTRLQSELGKNFAKKFGSAAGCKDKLRAEAAQLVGDAMARCKGAANQDACINDATAAGIAALTDKYGAASADEVADQIADEACDRLERELGDKFAKRFGSKAGCKTQVREKALPLAKAAIAKCQKAANQDACIQDAIDASTATISESFGAGPTLQELTEEIAEQVCARLKTELGERFAKKFGSLESCKKRVKDNTEAFAADALARCQKASNRAACQEDSIKGGIATLSERFGPGPTFEELAKEIGEQVCARLKAQLGPADWKRQFERGGGPTWINCQIFYVQKAERPIRAALAKCQKAADREGCIAQAVQDLSTSLADEFAGPLPGDVAFEILNRACDRLQDELGAKEFAAKFGDAPRCRDQLRGDATSLAQSAIAKCKKASNKQDCAEQAIGDATKTLTAKFGKGGPSVAELSDRLAAQACERLQKELDPEIFTEAFGPNTPLVACNAVIKDMATERARKAVLGCEGVPLSQRADCVEKALRASAGPLEDELRSRARYPSAKLLEARDAIAEQACQRAKEETGSKFEKRYGSMKDCKKSVSGDAAGLASKAFDKCNGKEACVRKEIEAQAEELLAKRLRPGFTGNYTSEQLGAEIVSRAVSKKVHEVGRDEFDKYLGSPNKAISKFRPLGAELAGPVIAKCGSVRPEDKKYACYQDGIDAQADRIRKAIDEVMQAKKK